MLSALRTPTVAEICTLFGKTLNLCHHLQIIAKHVTQILLLLTLTWHCHHDCDEDSEAEILDAAALR